MSPEGCSLVSPQERVSKFQSWVKRSVKRFLLLGAQETTIRGEDDLDGDNMRTISSDENSGLLGGEAPDRIEWLPAVGSSVFGLWFGSNKKLTIR